MNDRQESNRSDAQPDLYIDGYFSRRLGAGETPDYGYAKNHLPAVAEGVEMVVETGFITSRKSKR